MNSEIQQPGPEPPGYRVPWRFMDNWIGVGLLAIIQGVVFVLMLRASRRTELAQSAAVVLLELAYLLPVIFILAWRHVSWKAIGFGKFDWGAVGIGCGLLVVSYAIIIIHNLLLAYFKVDTQGDQIARLFTEMKSPFWFLIVGSVAAPFVEEIFFRGFLFQGFRQRYGWIKAMLLSAAIFAAAHLDLVALIPTFILGNLLAYVYHRSNSVWPGIILHFLVNAFSLCGVYFVVHYQDFIPR